MFMLDAEVDVGFAFEVDEDVWDDDRPGCPKFDYALYHIVRPVQVVLGPAVKNTGGDWLFGSEVAHERWDAIGVLAVAWF